MYSNASITTGLILALAVGGFTVWFSWGEPSLPKLYETTCFNSEGRTLYHSIDKYNPHITRWGKVTCIVKGIK